MTMNHSGSYYFVFGIVSAIVGSVMSIIISINMGFYYNMLNWWN